MLENRLPESAPDVVLVIPMWNDAARLAVFGPVLAEALAAHPFPVRCVVADDGSDADDRERLVVLIDKLAAIHPLFEVHLAAAHRGKGAVIREAWGLFPNADWLAFADADGSVTAPEMLGLISRAAADGRNVIAARVNTATTRVEASVSREILHHAYLWVARAALGLRSTDLQCGAKVLRGADFRRVAPLLREEGWAFDTELLSHFHRLGIPWDEVPVNWTAQDGGKVRPLRDAWRMIVALRRIRGGKRPVPRLSP